MRYALQAPNVTPQGPLTFKGAGPGKVAGIAAGRAVLHVLILLTEEILHLHHMCCSPRAPNLALVMVEWVSRTCAIDGNPAPRPTRRVAPVTILNREREGPKKCTSGWCGNFFSLHRMLY